MLLPFGVLQRSHPRMALPTVSICHVPELQICVFPSIISQEEFAAALKSLEESKRVLLYRAARGIDEEYMNRGLLSFIRSSIVNSEIDDSEIDSRVMSDEEKVIEKLVTGDKLFQPIPNQQTVSRPSRSVETSFEGIFWAFALLAFAVAIMLLINNTK